MDRDQARSLDQRNTPTMAKRVEEVLHGVALEDRFRGRPVVEAASFLGVSVKTIYRLVAEGKLGHIKGDGSVRTRVGRAGSVRVRLEDLVRFQLEREVQPTFEVAVPRSPARIDDDLRRATSETDTDS